METKEKFYLFVFEDNSEYEMKCAVSFKDAIWETAKYNGVSNELFRKSLKGFENDDSEDIVAMYNMFVCHPNDRIAKIYLIDKVVYNWNDVNAKECG